MKTITVHASKTYDITVGTGLLETVGARLRSLLPRAATLMLVTDDTVNALYGDTVYASLERAGFSVSRFVFPHGEASKSTETLLSLWNEMARAGLTRTDCAVALGGGVTGDMTGFAAATYLRGIACFQIPTTLLAMVDSSVGGKTAVDLPAGKNLCGAFSQPVGVLCDTDVLKTLPDDIFADGCAEVIKYGYLGDPALLTALQKPFRDAPEEIIARCIADKRDIVEADELDNGKRQLLNLGHTAGHAVEKLSGFTISHGSAVAIGMLLAARAAVALDVCAAEVPAHMEKLLNAYHLPTECPYTAKEMAAVALSDKKRRGDRITLIFPTRLGESVLYPVPADKLTEIFAAGGAQ